MELKSHRRLCLILTYCVLLFSIVIMMNNMNNYIVVTQAATPQPKSLGAESQIQSITWQPCEKNRLTQLASECGLVKINDERMVVKQRLSGGIAAKLGHWPSFAFYEAGSKNCGATIVGRDTLITGAHCMDKNDLGSVRAGFVSEDDPSYEQQRAVKKICHHQNEQLDVAIIRTKKPFYFNEFVQPACISFKHRFNRTREHVRYAVGMGATERHATKSDKVLVLPMQLSCDRRNIPKEVALDCLKPESYRTLGNICAGDTGGPIYDLDASGRHFVSHVITQLRNIPKGKLCAQTEFIDNLATEISRVEGLEHLFEICQ